MEAGGGSGGAETAVRAEEEDWAEAKEQSGEEKEAQDAAGDDAGAAEADGPASGLTGCGAERGAGTSGPLLRRLPVPLQCGGRGDGQERDSEDEEDSEEDEEALPAAMLGVLRSIPTQMDYKGQKLAEQIFQGIILVSAVTGFIYGYVTEQFGWTVYIVMAGFALSCLLTLPPWPMYRRNPLKWLPVQESGTEDKKPGDRKPKRHAKS